MNHTFKYEKMSSWYAFMRRQESWYSNMGFKNAQDILALVTTGNSIPCQVHLRHLFPTRLHLG